jgi:hypothetical protein
MHVQTWPMLLLMWLQTSGRLLFIATRCSLVLIVRCAWRSRGTYLAEAAVCGNEEGCGQNDKKNVA